MRIAKSGLWTRTAALGAALVISTPAAAGPTVGKAVPSHAKKTVAAALQGPPKYELKVHFMRVADNDGSNAAAFSEANANEAIYRANLTWRRYGGDVGFVLHPDTDLSTTLKITTINEDCQLAPGQSKTTIDANGSGDLDGDGQAGTGEDAAKLCDPGPSKAMRQLIGALYPDRIVVFVRKRSREMKWESDASPKHWLLDTGGYGASSAESFSVRMPPGSSGTLFAHEVGHYLHLSHPFDKKAKNVAHATSLVTEWMKKDATHPLGVFEGDGLTDTPPDAGGGPFVDAYGDKCKPDADTVSLFPQIAGQTVDDPILLAPDRTLIMSYFKGCAFKHKVSKQQYAKVHAALTTGNRQGLVAGGVSPPSPTPPTSLEAGVEQMQVALRQGHARAFAKGHTISWSTMKDVYFHEKSTRRGTVVRDGVRVDSAAEKRAIERLLAVDEEQ
jgi:hypothetical protein